MGRAVTLDDRAARAALLGEVGRELLDAMIDDAGGRTTAVRTQHVGLQPGRSLVVRFGVDVRWGEGAGEVVLVAVPSCAGSSGIKPGTSVMGGTARSSGRAASRANV